MRRMSALMAVGLVMILSLGVAAPAQALTLPPGAPATLNDVRQAVPASVLESLANDPDQKGYNAKFANITKYYDDPDTRAAKFRFPIQGLKKAGGAGAAIVGLQMGQGMSTATTSALFGIDTEGAVCSGLDRNNLELVSIIFGYDCTNALKMQLDYPVNAGQKVTWVGSVIKDVPATVNGLPAKVDVQYVGTATYKYSYHQYLSVCAVVTHNGSKLPHDGVWEVSAMEARFAGGYKFDDKPRYYTHRITGGTWGCAGIPEANGHIGNSDITGSPGDGWEKTGKNSIEGGVVAFGPLGAPQALTPQKPNPGRNFDCTVKMTDGSTVTRTSKTFTEEDGEVPAPECPQLPKGKVAATLTIDEKGGGETKPISGGETTPGYRDWATNFPECVDGSCVLDLQKKTAGTAVSCFSDPSGCADWSTDPAKADNFQCTYAGKAVALTECNTYGPTFKPDALPNGNTYGDPESGKPPAGKSNPTTTPQDVDLYNAGIQPHGQERRCFPSGYAAFNPIQWVMQPMQCAIEWAFVPDPAAVKEKVTEAKDAWAGTPPGQMGPVLTAWGNAWPHLDGCKGPRVGFKFMGMGGDYYPLDACKAPLDNVADVARVFGAIGMYFGAGLAITRYLGSTFGYTGLGSGTRSDD